MNKNKRTPKDDADYLAQLVLEEKIKTEVIVELREENKKLWASQAKLLDSLNQANDSLRVYREHQLKQAQQMSQSSSPCAPWCGRHAWDTEHGWRRIPAPGQE